MGFFIAIVSDWAGISVGVLTVLAACSPRDAVPRQPPVRDSSGISIVENHGPYEEWQVALPAHVRVGEVDGDSTYQFNDVQFAGRLSDGRIVVVDNSVQVRWYDPSGLYRSTVGGLGRGPGEFVRISSVHLTPVDTVIAYDFATRRATWLSPAEEYVRDFALREVPSGPLTLLGLSPEHRLAVSTSTYMHEGVKPNTIYMRKILSVLLASPSQIDTLARLPGGEAGVWTRFSGGSLDALQDLGLPFAHEVIAAATPEYYAVADGMVDEIRFYDWTGIFRRVARRPEVAGVPVTDADYAQYVEDYIEAARRAGRKSLGSMENTVRDMISSLPAGHTMPTFDQVLTGAGGEIWLRDFVPYRDQTREATWTVFGPDGLVRRSVITPANLRVTHVTSEYVTGVERDSLDVEYVVAYRLERRN